MLFDLFLVGVMAAASLYYGISHLTRRIRLKRHGQKVQAESVARGYGQSGPYQVLRFTTDGSVHQLQYPMPRKKELPAGPLTLYYDPYKPEHLLVEEDKTDLPGILFCLVLGGILAAITVAMVVSMVL